MTGAADTRVGVVGLGYVGLPLALALVDGGYEVVGVDIAEDRVEQLRVGKSYVRDVSDAEVETALDSGFEPTTEYEELSNVDAVSICVPTPLRKSGQPDVSYVVDAAERLAPILATNCIIALESTVYPGATEEVVVDALAKNGWTVGEDVFVAFSPERIDPGSETHRVADIPKVVGGVTEACGDRAVALYEPVFEELVQVSSSAEAEFVKLLENTFRSVNIGLVNELALTAERMDIDIWEVIDAAATKPFGYMPFYPGPGLGGHCIPVDPQHLSWKAKQKGFETRLIDLADRINRRMPEHIANRVTMMLSADGVAVLDADLLVLGVAYKPDVSDTRESPARDVMDLLHSHGANVQYHDPHVPKLMLGDRHYESRELSDHLLQTQDCVVIITDHSAIDLGRVIELAPRAFDTRNATGEYGELEHIQRM